MTISHSLGPLRPITLPSSTRNSNLRETVPHFMIAIQIPLDVDEVRDAFHDGKIFLDVIRAGLD